MNAPMLNHPALHHPGTARGPGTSVDGAPLDEMCRSIVEQRMAVRLDEADEARLARAAGADHRGAPIRARIGYTLIALGAFIAGAAAADGGRLGRPA